MRPGSGGSAGLAGPSAQAAVGAFADAGKCPADVREVTVVVSDPWEFGDEHGSNVFAATVRARSEDLVPGDCWPVLCGQHSRNSGGVQPHANHRGPGARWASSGARTRGGDNRPPC